MAQLIDPGAKILRYPEVLVKVKRGEAVWPMNVEFDLSNRCQLACQWCAFGYTHSGELMETGLAEKTLKALAEGGTRAITFTGGGEPALHPDFAAIARLVDSLKMDAGLYTNGVSIHQTVEALPYLSWVYVSLDAVDAASYRRAKGADWWMQVTNHIGILAKQSAGTAIGVGFLLNGDNWRSVAEAVHLTDTLGATYCQFRPVVEEGTDYAWVPEALRLLEAYRFPTDGYIPPERVGDPCVYYSPDRFLDMLNHRRSYVLCRGSSVVPCIGAGGEVWVCPNTRGKRLLGNLKEGSFDAIWQRRTEQLVGDDCRIACRDHALNETLEYVCGEGPHDAFV